LPDVVQDMILKLTAMVDDCLPPGLTESYYWNNQRLLVLQWFLTLNYRCMLRTPVFRLHVRQPSSILRVRIIGTPTRPTGARPRDAQRTDARARAVEVHLIWLRVALRALRVHQCHNFLDAKFWQPAQK
jgi:hypothetical protein